MLLPIREAGLEQARMKRKRKAEAYTSPPSDIEDRVRDVMRLHFSSGAIAIQDGGIHLTNKLLACGLLSKPLYDAILYGDVPRTRVGSSIWRAMEDQTSVRSTVCKGIPQCILSSPTDISNKYVEVAQGPAKP